MKPNKINDMFKAKKKICQDCYHVDFPKVTITGNLLIEIIVWLLFIPAGICYTIYRLCSKRYRCRSCGSTMIYSLDGEKGKLLLSKKPNQQEDESESTNRL